MKLIDNYLNKITMYRLVLYVLQGLIAIAIVLALLGILPFPGIGLAFSAVYFVIIGFLVNKLFAKVYKVWDNVESYEISAYILALIIKPPTGFTDIPFLFWAVVLMVASKFILAIGRKHIFNPVAVSVAILSLTLSQSANWWVGTKFMLPFVLVGGLLIVRKIRRFDLFLSFIIVATLASGNAVRMFLDTPMIFFGTVMLTEPLTTPPQRFYRIIYGALVGLLFVPWAHVGSFYFTPEIALLAGNVFSYLVSPDLKLVLKLTEKIQLAPDVWDFVFSLDKKINFDPGQYLEWTVPADNNDDRGNRRYFTIASSPTEENLRLGVKFYEPASTFKKKLLALNPGDTIMASQLAGDFTLPSNKNRKYLFLAGGIGITPFRSMIKFLTDTSQTRDIILLYGDRSPEEFVYKDVLDKIKTVYVAGEHINADIIKNNAPDFKDRFFYISGSHAFVAGLENEIKKLGVPQSHVKTDFFPGFA